LFVATPPNAMVFESGGVRIIDLMKVGLGAKIIGIVIILFASMVWLSPIFHIHQLTPLLNNTFLINNGTSQ